MGGINLSYVLTTFNKLTFLRVVLQELIQNKLNDEEIIVIDGGSTDGTREFLAGLKRTGKIDLFLSEKDKGESHGFNKGFLLAKGILIKVITDDDAFNHQVIQKCKEFMLLNSGTDIMAGNMGSIQMGEIKNLYWSFSFQDDFNLWRLGKLKNFFFNGTCLMIRRASLNLTGLFNTCSLLADMEFTLRVTGVASIAWCTGIISTRILNHESNNIKYADRAKTEDEKLCRFYDYKHADVRLREELNNRSIFKKIRSLLSGFKASVLNKKQIKTDQTQVETELSSFKEVHDYCMKWMASHELNKEIKFLIKE